MLAEYFPEYEINFQLSCEMYRTRFLVYKCVPFFPRTTLAWKIENAWLTHKFSKNKTPRQNIDPGSLEAAAAPNMLSIAYSLHTRGGLRADI